MLCVENERMTKAPPWRVSLGHPAASSRSGAFEVPPRLSHPPQEHGASSLAPPTSSDRIVDAATKPCSRAECPSLDVLIDTSEAGGDVVRGADEIMIFIEGALDGAVTVHQGHMPEIELTSETPATGIWALNDIVIWPNGMRLDRYGHYHETDERGTDGWRIKSSKLTRLHMDFVMPEEN